MVYEQKEESVESLEEAGAKATGTASYLAFSSIFTILVYGLAFIAIARLLGPSQYGVYVIAVSIAGAFGAVGNFGISTYFERQIPIAMARNKQELSSIIGSGIVAIVVLSCIIIAVGIAASHYLSMLLFHSLSELAVIYIALLSILFSMLYGIGNGALIGFNDGKGSAIASIIYTITQTALSISLVVLGYGVLGAVLGLLAGLLLGTAAVLARIEKHVSISMRISGIWQRIKQMLSFSLPIAGSNFLSSLPSNIAVILLGIYTLSSVVGNYGVASRVESTLGVFTGALVVMLPFFSGMLARNSKKEEIGNVMSYVLYVMFLLATPFIIFFTMFSHAIMYTVFPSYTSVYIYISLMSISVLFNVLSAPASSLVIGRAHVKKVLTFSAITGLSELLLLFLIMPALGAYGAIAVLFFYGSVLADFLYLHEIRKEGISIKPKRIYLALASNVALALVFLPVLMIGIDTTAKLAIAFALIFVAYPPIMALTGALKRRDAERISNATKSVPVIGKLMRVILAYASRFIRS
ncbi:MAG: oligosaccharide flippase family protein [Candidatus Micrarchaeaceae archaeon]